MFQVTGLLGPIELPFPEGCAKDACTAFSTGYCPVETGESIVYEIDLEVDFLIFLFERAGVCWLFLHFQKMSGFETRGRIPESI